jgi:predicted nuclease of predicted toxin-antitoxin system
VRLLFDQNLSRLLVGRFVEEFPDSVHVTDVGLDRATDREVWDFARARDYVITSKDSDFRQLAFLFGPPPKVVWLRVGNASTDVIASVLRMSISLIVEFAAAAVAIRRSQSVRRLRSAQPDHPRHPRRAPGPNRRHLDRQLPAGTSSRPGGVHQRPRRHHQPRRPNGRRSHSVSSQRSTSASAAVTAASSSADIARCLDCAASAAAQNCSRLSASRASTRVCSSDAPGRPRARRRSRLASLRRRRSATMAGRETLRR